MVEVDPFVLVVGTAVVGIAGILVANKLLQTNVPSPETTAAATTTTSSSKSKGKKKSKSKSKSAKHADGSSASESEEVNLNEIQQAGKPAVKAKEEVATKAAAAASKVPEEAPIDAPKKSKKQKETNEQKAARVERQKVKLAEQQMAVEAAAAKTKSATIASPPVEEDSEPEPEPELDADEELYDESVDEAPDGWAVVGDSKKKVATRDGDEDEEEKVPPKVEPKEVKEEKKEPKEPKEDLPPPPTEDIVTEEIEVDSKKIGLLIGPKGVTKIGIQNITKAEITLPKIDKDAASTVKITVSGTAASVRGASKAIKELCTKGYATILAPADFIEGQVTVHPKYMAEIIGKGGSCIKAIQNTTGVKITTPPGDAPKLNGAGQPITKVKIGLAGLREQVSIARNTILELTKYYHTAITHPGIVHKEMRVADRYYNYIIGTKGSEIKHIQSNYKVSVHIPSQDTFCQNVLIVGEENNVTRASEYIVKLLEKVDAQATERANNESIRDQNRAQHSQGPIAPVVPDVIGVGPQVMRTNASDYVQKRRDDDEEQEAWMKEYVTQGKPRMNLTSLLPSDFAPAGDSTEKEASSESVPVTAAKEGEGFADGPALGSGTGSVPSGSWAQSLSAQTTAAW